MVICPEREVCLHKGSDQGILPSLADISRCLLSAGSVTDSIPGIRCCKHIMLSESWSWQGGRGDRGRKPVNKCRMTLEAGNLPKVNAVEFCKKERDLAWEELVDPG